ncbi:GNAT family N-acetyltransferase [Pseudofrankia asymbiotica]|uniref:GNAT family N-acetyltransferase n=1 Tax=Pseudofrankia asymbiotica TaxID=1834516 RepID=A0A1V2IGQ9_9ACTN|nr:GNAT family N-acetyltransferase [Pseudofrankia asymbiotica]ONH32099.1 GNAT family N-acetyltransferase [Pseudofrankia asymbiotica]
MPTSLRQMDAPGDLGWVIQRHGELYASEFGWDCSFEELVLSLVAEWRIRRSPRDLGWVAEVDGERAGCVFCFETDARTGQLRMLLVEPRFRRHGVGRALVGACLTHAHSAGYERLTLWTNDVLTSARALYERSGFTLVTREPHHSFGVDLVAETYALDLGPSDPALDPG